MSNICPCYFQCENKTELGYCKTSTCINQKYNSKIVLSNHSVPIQTNDIKSMEVLK